MKKQLHAKVSKGEVIEVIETVREERVIYCFVVNNVVKMSSYDLHEIMIRYQKR